VKYVVNPAVWPGKRLRMLQSAIQLMPSGLQLLVNGENSPFISELICGLATALLVTEAYNIDFFML